MENKVWVQGQYVQVNDPLVRFGPNVRIHSNMVKVNGRYLEPTVQPPAVPGPPGTAPGAPGQPPVFVNGLNVSGGPPSCGLNVSGGPPGGDCNNAGSSTQGK